MGIFEVLLNRGGEKKLLTRIEALEKALEAQDSRLRMIKMEWESVLHKVNGVMGRLNARIRKSEAQETPEGADVVENTPAPPLGSHRTLAYMRGNRGVLPR